MTPDERSALLVVKNMNDQTTVQTAIAKLEAERDLLLRNRSEPNADPLDILNSKLMAVNDKIVLANAQLETLRAAEANLTKGNSS